MIEGNEAYALIKASSVVIAPRTKRRIFDDANRLPGQIASKRAEAETGEIILDIGGGDTLSPALTSACVQNLKLNEGDDAITIIDAANILIGIE